MPNKNKGNISSGNGFGLIYPRCRNGEIRIGRVKEWEALTFKGDPPKPAEPERDAAEDLKDLLASTGKKIGQVADAAEDFLQDSMKSAKKSLKPWVDGTMDDIQEKYDKIRSAMSIIKNWKFGK